MLVVDAGIVLKAARAEYAAVLAVKDDLVAPPLLWSEVRSALHEAAWRRQIPAAEAHDAHAFLRQIRVRSRSPAGLGTLAWRIADELGWATTYDAEFCALARLLDCRLVTIDARLHRGADRLGYVVSPMELED